MDTKKKELVGNFKNSGRAWRCEDRDVLDHDFPTLAQGRAFPYGIYDQNHNTGYVVIGTTHQTAAFAVGAIRSWWLRVGRRQFPGASRLAIEADSGGANGNRSWAWKVGLQDFADEFGLTITVGHYPAGASKWNPIEHRMFNLISANWAAKPLTSYEVMPKHIRTTRSSTGFHCRASLDRRSYPTKVKVSEEAKASVRLYGNSIASHQLARTMRIQHVTLIVSAVMLVGCEQRQAATEWQAFGLSVFNAAKRNDIDTLVEKSITLREAKTLMQEIKDANPELSVVSNQDVSDVVVEEGTREAIEFFLRSYRDH